jgi:hypothetical protein
MAVPRFVPNSTQAQREGKIRAAMAWLQGAMAAGPRPAAEVEAEALAAGHTHTTLATARARLSIRSQREGGHYVWIPPTPRKRQPVTR